MSSRADAPASAPAVDGVWRRSAGDAAGRLGALVAALAYLAGPGAVIALSPQVPGGVRAALLALTAAACVRPAWSPAILLLLVPLLPVWPTIDPTIPAAVVHLVVATQVVPWLLRRAAGQRPVATTSAVPAWAIFVLVAAVSMLVGFTPGQLSMAELAHVGRYLAAQVPGYVFLADPSGESRALPAFTALFDGLCCMLLVRGVVTRDTRHVALRAGAAGAMLTAVFGFYQAASGFGLQDAWRIFDAGIIRINATHVDPNALAAFYALLGPVIVGLAMGNRGWRRIAWGAGFGVVLVATVMTAGRAALAAMASGCGVLAWLALRRGLDAVDPWAFVRTRARSLVIAAAATAAGLVVLATVLGTALDVRHEQQTSYLHTWLYTFNLRQPPDAIAKGRVAVWQAMLAMIGTAPVTGVGLGNSVNEFQRFRADLGLASLPPDAHLSAHNTYLLVASELGALGLAAWLLMLAGVVIGIRAPGNLPARSLATWPAVGVVAGLAGYALTMLTGDRILLREDIVVGTTCAALATLGSGRLPRWWRAAAAIVVVATVVSWPARVVRTSVEHAGAALPPHEGLYEPQVGVRGDTYQWSKGYAVLYVPAEATRLRVPVRNLSPDVQHVEVFVDGRRADERAVPPGAWATLEYRLPPLTGHRTWHRMALQVTPTWRAPGDPRVLGVVIGEWEAR